jgi:hypothetical protein
MGDTGRRIEVRGWPQAKSTRPNQEKKMKQKRAGGMIQLTKCLPSKYKGLSSKTKKN